MLMKPTSITSENYSHLRKSLAQELLVGADRVRNAYREEVIRTAWNVGKILRGTLGLDD